MRLVDFLGGLARDRFFADVWHSGYHVVHGDISRFNSLAVLPALSSWRSMVDVHRGDIDVFLRDGSRARLPKKNAEAILDDLSTLYLNISSSLALDAQLDGLAADLGCRAADIVCEGFVSRAGALSVAHFDPEHNFHILLAGKKRWRIAQNHSITHPLHGYVIGADEYDDSPVQHHRHAAFPTSLPAEHDVVELQAGDSIYFAPGMWHEVECVEDARSVNFAVRPPSWSALIAGELESMLAREPSMRASAFASPEALAKIRDELLPRARALLRSVDPQRIFKTDAPNDKS